MEEFQKEDVVILKSGGPKMTIENIGIYTYEKKALCTWFDGTKKNSGAFKLEALKLSQAD